MAAIHPVRRTLIDITHDCKTANSRLSVYFGPPRFAPSCDPHPPHFVPQMGSWIEIRGPVNADSNTLPRHHRRVTERFVIRPDAEGFSVTDIWTGEAAIIAIAPNRPLRRRRGAHDETAQHPLRTRRPHGPAVGRGY
jgi:hypothetical protein